MKITSSEVVINASWRPDVSATFYPCGAKRVIFIKMQIFQFRSLIRLTYDVKRLQTNRGHNRNSKRCAGAACQLLPRAAWRKKVFLGIYLWFYPRQKFGRA